MSQTVIPQERHMAARGPIRRGALLLFGVALPAGVIALEATTGFCAGTFFDPIPSIWHILLVLVGVAINAVVWRQLATTPSRRYLMGFLNALAIGIAFYYSLVFLPLVPLSLVAVLFLGLGFLSLSPVLCLIATLCLRLRMRHWTATGEPQRVPGLVAGLLASVILVGVVHLPATLTDMGMDWAASPDPGKQVRGLRILRSVGSEKQMLLACYMPEPRRWDPIRYVTGITPPATGTARAIYYRVTGREFTAAPTPAVVENGMFDRRAGDWDEGQGGDTVGNTLRLLALKESRMDGTIEPEAATAYLEWTMVFRNDHPWAQREARAQIQLPPGSVVSRATLWVNDEPREAAFGGRAQVKEAYRSVAIQQRRDPLLVTTSGPDRVLVQCFPIPRAGQMRIRIGMTVPLQITDLSRAQIELPRFVERNFAVPDTAEHALWISSKSAVRDPSSALSVEPDGDSGFRIRTTIPDTVLMKQKAVEVERTPAAVVWTDDAVGTQKRTIVQTIGQREVVLPKAAVVVVDLSRAMHAELQQVATLVTGLPDGTLVCVIGSADGPVDVTGGLRPLDAALRKQIADGLMDLRCPGGADGVPALAKAWDIAAKNGCDILWIHGPQPVVMASTASLQQYLQRAARPRLYEWTAVPGSNRVAGELSEHLRRARVVPDEADALLAAMAEPKWFAQRAEAGQRPAEALKVSGHIARLWAADQVQDLSRQDMAGRGSATRLAAEYQLVTPVTGAVVLERADQYAQNNLQPVDPASVPTVPEPAMLIVLPLSYLLLARRR